MAPQNDARAIHDLPPLKWDVKLRQYAQRYARKRKEDCALVHSHGPYGENIFWGSGTSWKPVQAAVMWVDERNDYNHTTDTCTEGKECGHYTQIVWKNTERIGCARVVCLHGKGIFMTCNYDPPGNYMGKRPY
ncbi:pathogenesis-related protein PR-1-like [Impatiens glandulifera]|uniref:pathogenesis-related protein PR-1-like n=1 Tax=Impatiens glandulifera TaxID=253017 RepID=UPI001FB16246|nr:pathogenesis-related protein PR-1-like [Impatiens glandulifera]